MQWAAPYQGRIIVHYTDQDLVIGNIGNLLELISSKERKYMYISPSLNKDVIKMQFNIYIGLVQLI
jgi:hypothetical protein